MINLIYVLSEEDIKQVYQEGLKGVSALELEGR